MSYTNDYRVLYSCGTFATVIDPNTFESSYYGRETNRSAIQTMNISPDRSTVVTCDNSEIQIWKVATCELVCKMILPSDSLGVI